MKIPRLLRPEEIECRVQRISEGKGRNEGKYFATLLLYKDARCDMRLLDETFGPENWQRDHKTERGNLFCGIGVWDEQKKVWVWKWDAGSESNQDAEKGHASDSFKRAGFNWGIGRELYTAPFVYIELMDKEYDIVQGKPKAKSLDAVVREINYNDKREIVSLVITDRKGNIVRYAYGK